MANQKQQYGPEWQRAQMLKQNTVRIKLAYLNPHIRAMIGEAGPKGWLEVMAKYPILDEKRPLRQLRRTRAMHEVLTVASGGGAIGSIVAVKNATASAGFGVMAGLASMKRTMDAYVIRRKHNTLAQAMQAYGILAASAEHQFPDNWMNPAEIAKTHPIFTVQRNGNVIFRRVTKKEFWLLKQQEKWVGKAGVNLWRWRGTLRKPLAPEVERQKVSERLRALSKRFLPAFQPRPALAPARKTGPRRMNTWRK